MCSMSSALSSARSRIIHVIGVESASIFMSTSFHSKKMEYDIERIKAKLEEQNAMLVKKASGLPQH